MIADLTKEEKTENLEDKRRLLEILRKRMDFADIQKAYDNWRFSDLVGDNDFKRMYEDRAVKEREKPDSEYFEENIGKYIKLVEEGKEIASRYFGKWKVNFQAYCEEINNNRVLNVNLIHYDKSEPTRISDILQQEKDIKELNIYCNKKHEIHAHRKGKERHYKFKEGAYYKMTSTWPVKDGSEMCTMIMNVSSDGITEILKFNNEDFVLSEEVLELIKQNDELYIQSLSLYDAVLEKGKAADVVPINFHIDLQQAETETQTEIDSQPIATQTKVNLQHTETQPEVASQQITDLQNRFGKEEQKNTKLQTELAQKDEELASALAELQGKAQELKSVYEEKGKLSQELKIVNAEKEELKSELKELKKELRQVQEENSNLEDKFDHLEHLNKKMDGNQEQLSEQVLDLQKELSCSKEVIQKLTNKLKSAEAEKKEVNQELAEAEQRIEALEKQTSELKDKLKKKEQGSKAEIDEICKELTQLKENLKRNEEEFKSVHEEKRKLEDKLKGVNTEKKESEDKLKEFEKEIDQAAHIMKEKEQFISNLKYQMLGLENEYKAQLESYEQEIGKLENMHDEFKEYVASILESMDREHEDEIKKLKENRDALSDIIADKVLDIEDLMKKLQNSEKEKEFFRGRVEELNEEIYPLNNKSREDKISNDHAKKFYALTEDTSDEPDNLPPEGEKKLSRSSSVDSGLNSDEENCDNDLSSNISSISSVEKVAERGNVGKVIGG